MSGSESPFHDEGMLLVQVLWRQRWLCVAALVAGALLAFAASFGMTKWYRSEVVLVPVTEDPSTGGLGAIGAQLGGFAALAGLDLRESELQQRALAVLRSRAFVEDFIREANLLPILFSSRWDAGAKQWKASDPEDIPTMEDAYRYFDRKVRRVHEDQKTGLVTLTILWKDAATSANWANELVQRLNASLREREVDESKRSLQFLDDELRKTSVVELQNTIFRLIESQMRRAMLANVRDELAFAVVDPAVKSDADRYDRPRRLALTLIGGLLGLAGGIMVALLRAPALMARRPVGQ